VKHDLKNGLHDGSTWVDGTVYRLRRTGGKDNE
jgi:hypothetical protein